MVHLVQLSVQNTEEFHQAFVEGDPDLFRSEFQRLLKAKLGGPYLIFRKHSSYLFHSILLPLSDCSQVL